MKVDLYTKCVLTVIAACLLTLVLKDPQRAAAQADNPGLRVVIAGYDPSGRGLNNGLPVAMGTQQPVPITVSGNTLPVQITNQSVPVTMAGRIPVATNVTQVAGREISAAGVPVLSNVVRVAGREITPAGVPVIAATPQ